MYAAMSDWRDLWGSWRNDRMGEGGEYVLVG